MKYIEAIQAVDTERALQLCGLEGKKEGAYIKFLGTCGHDTVVRFYGEKKNITYCPTCKKGGNIFQLALALKGIDYSDLVDKTSKPSQPIEEELNLNYVLEYTKDIEKLRLNQELCEKLGVGKPRGKTMLSGTIAFTVFNEHGLKVAYFGLKPDGTNKFHQSFNPELYLYNYHNINHQAEVWITKDMLNCLWIIQSGKQSVCNFGLPYLSTKQYQLLSDCDRVVFDWSGDKRDIAYSNIASLKTFYRFA